MKLYLNCTPHQTNDEPTFNKQDYLLLAAKHLGLQDIIVPYNREPNPEFVLNIEPYPTFIKGSQWTGIWEIDLLCDREQTSNSDWGTANTVFIAISTIPNRLECLRQRTVLLFQACDPNIHKRYFNVPQTFDFVFCGSQGAPFYDERRRVMEVMRQHFSFTDFPKGKDPVEYTRCLNAAKVQFIRSMQTPIANGEIAQRFFECLAIGPVLTNYVPDLQHTGLIEGEDYLAYRNDEEMLEKMHLLLDSQELRDKIATSGRQKAMVYHTYENRLATIINFITRYGYSVS